MSKRHRLLRAWPAAIVVGVAVLALVPARATASHTVRWPGPTITYYNAASAWAWSVRQAVAAWNASGVSPRFVRARSRRNAQLTISTARLPRVGPDAVVAGRATLGYVPGRQARVQLARPARWNDRFYMARVAAHELGHVLGLRHTDDRRCALMVHQGSAERWGGCAPIRSSQWRCRMVELHDANQAYVLYRRGRPKAPRTPDVCFKYGVPAAPADLRSELTVTETARDGVARWSVGGRLAWRNPSTRSFAGIHVSYRLGACPSSPSDSAATVLVASADDSLAGDRHWAGQRGRASSATLSFEATAPGLYCFAVWSSDEAALRHSGAAATVSVAIGPVP